VTAAGPCRRRRTVAVVALVLAALGAALWLPSGGAAAAESCEWQPQKVPVVKHLKRHGRRVRVVRHQVRWSCLPLPAAPIATPSAPVTPPVAPPLTPPATPPAEESGDAHYIGARAYEYGFEPTGERFEAEAGEDTIELVNGGEDAHDLYVEPVGSGENVLEIGPTAAGKINKGKIDLEAGEYRLYCSFKEHAMKGMERTLVVVP
jgi:plastocyanin